MHTLVALLVFAIGLGATLYYWKNLRQSVQTEMDNTFDHQIQMVADAMQNRINLYENFLRGSAGLVAINGSLTQNDWDTFNSAYNIPKNYPSIESVGVSRYLRPDDVAAYLQRRQAQGDVNFQISPAGERAAYTPITFDTIFSDAVGSQSRGFDGYSDPVRRLAMDHAVETNRLVMSGKISLAQKNNQTRSAYMLFLPVYQNGQPTETLAQRKAALLGFVHVTVDAETFLNRTLDTNPNPNVGLQLKDGEGPQAGSALYQSNNFDQLRQGGAHLKVNELQLYGHAWQATFAASSEILSARDRQLPEQALWRGLVTCIFFAGLVWYLITDRERKYARQKREEVQTAKDDLLSLASHQLRTPATVVKQYVGMLLQGYGGKLSDQQLSMLDHAYSSNERQLEIINQLLYVARLDAGRITLHTKEIDLSKLLRDVAREQSEALTAREQSVTFHIPKRSIHAEVDPHYMRMVLENLLSNAIKYTPEKGSISLEIKRAPAEVLMVVKDDGVGISAEVQASIFDKFTRVENELSNDVNGSGVGLYLTKQIVELHGGTIEVQSEPEKGSSFIVRVPTHALENDTESGAPA